MGDIGKNHHGLGAEVLLCAFIFGGFQKLIYILSEAIKKVWFFAKIENNLKHAQMCVQTCVTQCMKLHEGY